MQLKKINMKFLHQPFFLHYTISFCKKFISKFATILRVISKQRHVCDSFKKYTYKLAHVKLCISLSSDAIN